MFEFAAESKAGRDNTNGPTDQIQLKEESKEQASDYPAEEEI